MKGRFLSFLARRRQSGNLPPPKENRCPFPDCGVEFDPIPGKPEVCEYHRKLIADVTFILGHLRPRENKPKGPNLVVPGGIRRHMKGG